MWACVGSVRDCLTIGCPRAAVKDRLTEFGNAGPDSPPTCVVAAPPVREGEEDRMANEPHESLTPREEEVLELVKQRLTNEEIASTLFISVKTVQGHVSSILAKLGHKNRRVLWRDTVG